MSYYTVSTTDMEHLSLQPETAVQSIIQNVACCMMTKKGSVPMDRVLGLDWRALDSPVTLGPSVLASDIIDAITYGEPRCKVVDITFSGAESDPGKVISAVTIDIPEEYQAPITYLALPTTQQAEQSTLPAKSAFWPLLQQAVYSNDWGKLEVDGWKATWSQLLQEGLTFADAGELTWGELGALLPNIVLNNDTVIIQKQRDYGTPLALQICRAGGIPIQATGCSSVKFWIGSTIQKTWPTDVACAGGTFLFSFTYAERQYLQTGRAFYVCFEYADGTSEGFCLPNITL